MSTPLQIISQHSKSDDWLFDDAEEGTEALRDSCVDTVLIDELFFQVGELPERMQQALMKALRGGDTFANDHEVGRIMRAAFNRAVDEALEFKVSRLQDEAAMGADHDF